MGATATIGLHGLLTPSQLPPQAAKVHAKRVLELALACFRDGEIDAITALHAVDVSSKEREKLLASAFRKLREIEPRDLGHKKPRCATRARIAIAEIVWTLLGLGYSTRRALPIVRSWIERSGYFSDGKIPAEGTLDDWHRALKRILDSKGIGSPLAEKFRHVTYEEMQQALDALVPRRV